MHKFDSVNYCGRPNSVLYHYASNGLVALQFFILMWARLIALSFEKWLPFLPSQHQHLIQSWDSFGSCRTWTPSFGM